MAVLVMPWSPSLFADPPWGTTGVVEVSSAVVVDAKGTVTVDTGAAKAQPVKMQEEKAGKSVPALLAGLGATLRTGPESEATIVLPGSGQARVGPNSEVRLPVLPAIPSPSPTAPAPAETSIPASPVFQSQMGKQSLELLKGTLFLNINPAEVKKRGDGTFRLKTPVALLAVKGTEFFASTDGTTDTAGVHEGSIYVYEPNTDKFIVLERGSAVEITAGGMDQPRRLTPAERRTSAMTRSLTTRQQVLVSRWDLQTPDTSTNFSINHPFGTIHRCSGGTRDLLLDLSSVQGTPVAIEMLVRGGGGGAARNNVSTYARTLDDAVHALPLATAGTLQASLSFAGRAEEHLAARQTVPLTGFFVISSIEKRSGKITGGYLQSMSVVHFLLPPEIAATRPKLGRVRLELSANKDAEAEVLKAVEYCKSQRFASLTEVTQMFMGRRVDNISGGIEITGVSILTAD